MTWSFVGSSAPTGAGTTSAALAVPSGTTNGDFMVLVLQGYFGGGTLTIPTGWTSLKNTAGWNGSESYCLAYRVASSEPSSYTVTSSASGWPSGSLYVIRSSSGCAYGQFATTQSTAYTNSSMPAPSLTGVASTSAVIYGYSGDNSGQSGTISEASPSPGNRVSSSSVHQNTSTGGTDTGIITVTGSGAPGSATATSADYQDFAIEVTAAGGTTHNGAASLSGTGTLTAAGSKTVPGAASLSGTGTLTAAGSKTVPGAAALSGSGTLTAGAHKTVPGAASLSGTGTLTAAGHKTVPAAAALSGTGTLTAAGSLGLPHNGPLNIIIPGKVKRDITTLAITLPKPSVAITGTSGTFGPLHVAVPLLRDSLAGKVTHQPLHIAVPGIRAGLAAGRVIHQPLNIAIPALKTSLAGKRTCTGSLALHLS